MFSIIGIHFITSSFLKWLNRLNSKEHYIILIAGSKHIGRKNCSHALFSFYVCCKNQWFYYKSMAHNYTIFLKRRQILTVLWCSSNKEIFKNISTVTLLLNTCYLLYCSYNSLMAAFNTISLKKKPNSL